MLPAVAAGFELKLSLMNAERLGHDLQPIEPITLHEARHTFASLMIAAGVNAKALSTYRGHSSITITYDRYGHLMPGNEEEAAGLLDAYLAGQKWASEGPEVGGFQRTRADDRSPRTLVPKALLGRRFGADRGMAPGGVEPPHADSKSAALSTELRGPGRV